LTLAKVILKAVFLNNGKKFPSVPLANAANMEESMTIKLLFTIYYIQYFGQILC
jgi:hypothetical protein